MATHTLMNLVQHCPQNAERVLGDPRARAAIMGAIVAADGSGDEQRRELAAASLLCLSALMDLPDAARYAGQLADAGFLTPVIRALIESATRGEYETAANMALSVVHGCVNARAALSAEVVATSGAVAAMFDTGSNCSNPAMYFFATDAFYVASTCPENHAGLRGLGAVRLAVELTTRDLPCVAVRGAAVWGALALTAREHGETMDAASRVAGVSDLLVGALVGDHVTTAVCDAICAAALPDAAATALRALSTYNRAREFLEAAGLFPRLVATVLAPPRHGRGLPPAVLARVVGMLATFAEAAGGYDDDVLRSRGLDVAAAAEAAGGKDPAVAAAAARLRAALAGASARAAAGKG